MANKLGPFLSKRNFGHCIVTWEIKNYGRTFWNKNLEIETPEFLVTGPKNTKWKLVVQTEPNHTSLVQKLEININSKPKEVDLYSLSNELEKSDLELESRTDEKEKSTQKKRNENESSDSTFPVKNVMLYLVRASEGPICDEEPKAVWVDWRVYCIGINGEKFSVAHEGHYFEKECSYGTNIGVIYDLESEFNYNSGTMTLLCDMIVNTDESDNIDVDFDGDMNIDLCGLSEDLQWIFNQQKFCDTEVKVDGKSIMVHKAIICSHSNFFQSSVEDVIELSDIKYSEMLKTLEYMYSYELKDVIGQPSISMYDSFIHMNLRDLVEHYVPEEQKISTTLDIRKRMFLWIIKDFNVMEVNCISSPIFCKKMEDVAWQIDLYPRGIDGKSEYIAIAVKCIEGDICDELCIECTVLEDSEKLNFWKILRKSEKVGTIYEDETFIQREDFSKALNNDSIRIGLKVRIYTGNENSIVHNACTPVLYSVKKSFENMVNNMLTLHQNKKYTDVILKIGVEEIKAHRFILSARSRLLSSILENTNDNMILISNVSPEILKILLDYMYCAVLNVSDTDTVIDVYKAAEEFVISRLQEKCSRILGGSLTVDTVFSILRLANDYDDQSLKAEALQFIGLNKIAFKSKVLEDLKSEAHLSFNEGEATFNDEKNENKLLCSVPSKVKTVTIVKYNEDSISSVDYEITSKPLPEKNITNSQNNKGNGIESISSYKVEMRAKCLKQSEINGGKKTSSEMQTSIADDLKFPSKPQKNKLDVPLKKRDRNETDFPDNTEEEKAIQSISQRNEMINLRFQSQDEAIIANKKSYSPNKNEFKKELTSCETSSKIEQKNEEICVNKFAPILKAYNDNLGTFERELKAIPLDELHKNGQKSSADLDASSGNGLKSGTTLDELNGNKIESDAALYEPQTSRLVIDTALGESHENKSEATSIADEPL